MKSIWILLGIALAVCAVSSQSEEDFWDNDYDSEWYDEEIEKLSNIDENDKVAESEPVEEEQDNASSDGFDPNDAEADEKVEEEIQQFLEEPNKVLNDYQIEDNRSKLEDYEDPETINNYQEKIEETDLEAKSEEQDLNNEDDNGEEEEQVNVLVRELPEQANSEENNESNHNDVSIEKKYYEEVFISEPLNTDDELEKNQDIDQVVDEESNDFNNDGNKNKEDVPEPVENNFDNPEFAQVLQELESESNENINADFEEVIPESSENHKDESDTNQESKQMFDEEADNFDSDESKNDENDDLIEKYVESVLEETKRILEENSSSLSEQEVDENENNQDNMLAFIDNLDNLGENDEEHSVEDDEFADVFADLLEKAENDTDDNNSADKSKLDEENIDETVDKAYSQMKEDFNKLFDTIDKLVESSESNSENDDVDVNVNIAEYEAIENRPFNEDNILRLREEQYEDENVAESNEETVDDGTMTEEKSMLENEVTSAELNDLMVKFKSDHAEDLDTQSRQFDKNVAAVTMRLTADEATVVTSPNYPDPYPTNNIVDWIFEGQGMGIEMNITDFSVNGFLGDYLLVKPDGVDETGHNGLVFSYNLNQPRLYRFSDVNRMFVRFEAKAGMAFTRGFSFSVKMITPPAEEPVETPETEASIEAPKETFLVYVGGVVPSQFTNISEEFRLIVADMATLYINMGGDDLGDKTTVEVTQITQTAVCNTNWPGFERCTAVRFGIPLVLPEDEEYRMSEDDLRDMWDSLVTKDPFASRMRQLGISEFAVPNDESTLLVWVVISLGVIISAAMLGLALWRWSCFEDYTRMAPNSDTDSIYSEKKKPLELYPAPHQNLPALYDDDFVKYDYDTTRIDLGGYANQSYTRDADIFDIESDDDVRALPTTKRDSNTEDKDVSQV